jgi:hypothetical protein
MNFVSELVAQLGSDDQVKAYQARQKLADTVARASKPAEQNELAAALATELTAKDKDKPKHSPTARKETLKLLSLAAGDEQVPALVECLKDLELRMQARWALERIPTAAATAALVKALEQVGPEFLTGVVIALGRRTGADVVAALHKAAQDADDEVRLAAIESLANLAERSNDDVIAAATKTGSPRARARAQKARVRLAETLRNAGQKDAAVAIYKAIAANDADEPQKKAARLALEQLT